MLTSRSEKNGEAAVAFIKEKHPEAKVQHAQLDLASIESIDAFCKQYDESGRKLHVLILNAGVMACPRQLTHDGLEMQFGVNHIGHMRLTLNLLDVMKRSFFSPDEKTTNFFLSGGKTRVVSVASIAHYIYAPLEGLSFGDLRTASLHYDEWDRYGQSKLCNVLFAKELQKRHGDVLQSVSVHPGMIAETDLKRHMGFVSGVKAFFKTNRGLGPFLGSKYRTTDMGAAPQVALALGPIPTPGAYYADDAQLATKWVHEKVHDDDHARHLWELSIDVINEILAKKKQ